MGKTFLLHFMLFMKGSDLAFWNQLNAWGRGHGSLFRLDTQDRHFVPAMQVSKGSWGGAEKNAGPSTRSGTPEPAQADRSIFTAHFRG
jgi:hypothetical protein